MVFPNSLSRNGRSGDTVKADISTREIMAWSTFFSTKEFLPKIQNIKQGRGVLA